MRYSLWENEELMFVLIGFPCGTITFLPSIVNVVSLVLSGSVMPRAYHAKLYAN